MTIPDRNELSKLAAMLDGSTIMIPNLLHQLPEGWYHEPRPGLIEQVNDEIESWLDTLDMDKVKLARHRRKGNYVLLAAYMYPHTSKEKLVITSKALYWTFLFDDEIDSGGDLASNQPGTMNYCTHTRLCINECLRSPHGSMASHPTMPPNAPAIAAMFYPILNALRDGMDDASCNRLASDFLGYVDAVEAQQTLRMTNVLPSIDEYLRLRAGDIGVRAPITENEYAMSFALPQEVYDSPPMKEILRLAVELVVLANDLLSLQKEVGDGQLDNIVTLLVAQESLSLDQAVAEVVRRIGDGYSTFMKATRELGVVDEKGTGMTRETWEYVLGVRALVVANIMWSINCERYFKASQMNEEGQILLKLYCPSPLA